MRSPRRILAAAAALFGLLVCRFAFAQETTPMPAPSPTPTPPAVRFYGWIQQGFTANFDSPRDRVNFGVNFNWRSNDYRLNQVYFILDNLLEHESAPNVGYRIDFMVGHDAPFLAANGLFSSFTGFDPSSGFGTNGPESYRNVNRIGIDLPQFYVEVHLPSLFSGVDFRLGKFYTYVGREVYPGGDTDFYSRTYENILGTPFTHTGFLATVHASPQWDVIAGVVVGADVFKDNNSAPSFHGAFIWNSADKRYNWTTAWITGPEQPHDNHDDRTVASSYLTAKLDKDGNWLLSAGGHYGFEQNAAVDPMTGARKDADWYALAANLFYSVNERWRPGFRFEWFRDDEGTRTAVLGRPGFAASFYDATLGATWKPWGSLSLRPEIRFDWVTGSARPFDDQTARSQLTAAVDAIWRF
ncbi:MAG TPA: outer membrane beta-barrel protein [Thermoanaerobaculia bacterium]|nr:outer membrane beta-barrel protein [Thermoanaerobaculia bacterium]